MTVEIKDSMKIMTKRTDHPSAKKYPGRPSFEFGQCFRKFLVDLTPDEYNAFAKNELFFNPGAAAEFFDSILEGDVVGLGLIKGLNDKCEPSAHKFKITKIDTENDVMQARDCTYENPKYPEYKGQEVQLTIEDLSCALGMGFGEILERDGKPFGVSEEIEMLVNFYGEKDESVVKIDNNSFVPESSSEEKNNSIEQSPTV